MCHTIGEKGVDFGPNLTAFGTQQTREVSAQEIASPSADIAHGFEGHVVKTKEGKTIYGMIVSTGDPVVIQSAVGLFQTVPAEQIASKEKAPRYFQWIGEDFLRIPGIVRHRVRPPPPNDSGRLRSQKVPTRRTCLQ